MNNAAQSLGRLAKGVPKNYSAAEIERRSNILAGINARKRAKAKKRRMPNMNSAKETPHSNTPENMKPKKATLAAGGAQIDFMNTKTATAPPVGRSALFIPLRREWFEAFESGDKTIEYRPYGPRWNERTCRVGRRVTLSLGYGKRKRLHGTIVSFELSEDVTKTSAWLSCYVGKGYTHAAKIGVRVDGTNIT